MSYTESERENERNIACPLRALLGLHALAGRTAASSCPILAAGLFCVNIQFCIRRCRFIVSLLLAHSPLLGLDDRPADTAAKFWPCLAVSACFADRRNGCGLTPRARRHFSAVVRYLLPLQAFLSLLDSMHGSLPRIDCCAS